MKLLAPSLLHSLKGKEKKFALWRLIKNIAILLKIFQILEFFPSLLLKNYLRSHLSLQIYLISDLQSDFSCRLVLNKISMHKFILILKTFKNWSNASRRLQRPIIFLKFFFIIFYCKAMGNDIFSTIMDKEFSIINSYRDSKMLKTDKTNLSN